LKSLVANEPITINGQRFCDPEVIPLAPAPDTIVHHGTTLQRALAMEANRPDPDYYLGEEVRQAAVA
jgi:hypothetical protein